MYELFQLAPDGAYVIDSEHNTLEEAEEAAACLGSKWFFYPISAIIKGKTIVETGGLFYATDSDEPILSVHLKRRRFGTLVKLLQRTAARLGDRELSYDEYEIELIKEIETSLNKYYDRKGNEICD